MASSSMYTLTGVPGDTPNELVRSTNRFVSRYAFGMGVTEGVVCVPVGE